VWSALPPRRRRPAPFEPRFTLGLLYLGGFFFLFALLSVAAPLWELWQSLPPGAEGDEEALARATELARQSVRPRLWIALAAALVTTALGAYAGVLPGTGRRR
jgi:hypothetical protein